VCESVWREINHALVAIGVTPISAQISPRRERKRFHPRQISRFAWIPLWINYIGMTLHKISPISLFHLSVSLTLYILYSALNKSKVVYGANILSSDAEPPWKNNECGFSGRDRPPWIYRGLLSNTPVTLSVPSPFLYSSYTYIPRQIWCCNFSTHTRIPTQWVNKWAWKWTESSVILTLWEWNAYIYYKCETSSSPNTLQSNWKGILGDVFGQTHSTEWRSYCFFGLFHSIDF